MKEQFNCERSNTLRIQEDEVMILRGIEQGRTDKEEGMRSLSEGEAMDGNQLLSIKRRRREKRS